MLSFLKSFGRIALIGVFALTMSGIAISAQPSSRAQAAPPVSAQYVPAEAVLYLALDTHILSAQWVQAAILSDRLGGPSEPERFTETLLEGQFEDGFDLDITPFIGGEVAMVMLGAGSLFDSTDPEQALNDPGESAEEVIDGIVIVSVPSDIEAAQAELQRALDGLAADRGTAVETITHGDATIVFLPGDTVSDAPGVAFVRIGDALAMSTSTANLEPFIDLDGGEGNAISDVPGFEAAHSAMPDERVAFGFLNGPAIVADSLSLDTFGTAVEAFVPGGSHAVTGFAISSEADGFLVDTRTVSADGEPIRTFGEHLDSNLIGNLPAETQIAISGSDFASTRLLDGALSIVFALLGGIFSQMTEPGAVDATPEPMPETLEEAAAAGYELANSFLGVDIKGGFVDLMDGEFLFGVWNTGGGTSDPSVGFVSETSDPATMDQTLSTLTMAAGFLLGTTSHVGMSGVTTVDVGAGHIELDVVEETLVIGYGGGGSALISSPESALVESSIFTTVTEPLPEDRSLLIFVNVDSLQNGPGSSARSGRSAPFGLSNAKSDGPAFAFVTFNDGDEMGGQGYFYIPEP